MSTVQIRVYRNGAYTTRNATIEEILAANREEEHKPLGHSPRPTIYGLLSRTVVRSPVLKSIIPARLRHEDHNDVVYVHEDFIEIIEVCSDGQELKHIATKADFGSRIRAARVFGEARRPKLETSYSDLKVSVFTHFTHSLEGRHHEPRVKSERVESTNRSTSPAQTVPSHILVLSMEAPELVFLFASRSEGEVEFTTKTRPLPANRSFLEQPGKHIAVDPKSRALAVAACEGMFLWYSLKSTDQIRQEFETSAGQFDPVIEERILHVDGVILRMEFLHPPAEDHEHVLLLLVVAKPRRTRLYCYEWDCSTSLRTAGLKVKGQRLPQAERLPLLLIPLRVSSAFMLVCEHVTAIYKDISSGTAQAAIEPEPNDDEVRLPGISRRKPLWTGWARPVRFGEPPSGEIWEGFDVTRMTEDLYMAREDGCIKYRRFAAQPGVGGAWLPSDQAVVGNFGCNVDLSFASLDLPLLQPDLLVSGGGCSDGALYSIGGDGLGHPRIFHMSPKLMKPYANWTPVTDCVLEALGEGSLGGRGLQRPSRIFITSGRQPYGTVTEVRNGVELQIDHEFQIPQLDNAVNMWSLSVNGGYYLLLSFPTFSALMFSATHDDINECEEDPAGIDGSSETIFASTGPEQRLIQVTSSQVVVVEADKGRATRTATCGWPSSVRVTKAAIHEALIAVTSKHELHSGAFELGVAKLSTSDGSTALEAIGPRIPLPGDPSCLAILNIRRLLLVLVCISSSLYIYKLDPQHGLSSVAQHELLAPESSNSSIAACESVAILSIPGFDYTLLLFGMRNGVLCTAEVASDCSGEISINRKDYFAFGDTPVKLVQKSDYSALALCGSNTCQLTCAWDGSLIISSIWFVNQDQTPFTQRPLVTLRPSCAQHVSRGDSTGLYSCILGTSLLFAHATGETKCVPRRIPIDGTPQRLIYCKHLDRLVVASMKTSVREYQSKSTRVTRATIQFIDPDGPIAKAESINGSFEPVQSMPDEIIGKPGERIYSLLDWICEDNDGKQYNFLVVGTGYMDSNQESEKGRLHIFKTLLQDNGMVHIKSTKEIKLSSPVYSLAACGRAAFICSSGTKVILYRVSFEPPGFSSVCEISLRSSAVHITVEEPYVYITTHLDSLLVFNLADDRFVPVFSDGMSRSGCHHLVLNVPNNEKLILAANKQSSLVGLLQPQHRSRRNAMPIAFEASLPRSITRLRKGNIRPPWQRKGSLPGIVHDDIIGTATDGSVYAFSILNEQAWRLLRFIQNLCLRNKDICPHTSDLTKRRLHIEPDVSRKTNFHVDGDVLMRLLEGKDGEGRLMDMLSVHPEDEGKEGPAVDYDSGESRLDRFGELVVECLGEGDGKGQSERHGELVARTLRWLRDVLAPVL